MRKLLLGFLLFTSIAAQAQQRLKSFAAPIDYSYMGQSFIVNLTGNLTYDNDGSVNQLIVSMDMMGYKQGMLTTTYEYAEGSLKQTLTIAQMGDAMTTESQIEGGLASNITYIVEDSTFSLDLSYTEDGRLHAVDGSSEGGNTLHADLTWEGGNLQRITATENETTNSEVRFEYGSVKSTPALNAIVAYFVEQALNEYSFLSFTPARYFGITCANLPTKVTRTGFDEEPHTDVTDGEIHISYTTGNDGYPTEVGFTGINLELDEDMTLHNLNVTLEWEDDPTGIHAPETAPRRQPTQTYSIDGRRLSKPARGINIIRNANGTSSKLIVK